MPFVNRMNELTALDRWWDRPAASMGLVWGRRRVGKTALLQRFAADRRTVFHTAAGRPPSHELRLLSRSAANIDLGTRDLQARPFTDWDDAIDALAGAARDEPLLVVLDEFPELLATTQDLAGILRAAWDRIRGRSRLRLLLSGSAVRTMESMLEERAPLYGRFDLQLMLHPFRPHEATRMLPGLTPTDMALVWGIVGGMPMYLERWDASASVRDNLAELVCTPGGFLLGEGRLVLATEAEPGDLPRQVLYAIAGGRTKHNEIADAVRADPTRTLERLVELRLVERMVPVTEDVKHTRRRLYRVADNFLAFWLGVVDPYRAEIERGLGRSILPIILRELDDHLGPIWEEAFRAHLRRLAEEGALGEDVVAVGRYWTASDDPIEIDAVVLRGRDRLATLLGEAKWSRRVDARRIRRGLERKAAALPASVPDPHFAVCARESVERSDDVLAITAEDVFG